MAGTLDFPIFPPCYLFSGGSGGCFYWGHTPEQNFLGWFRGSLTADSRSSPLRSGSAGRAYNIRPGQHKSESTSILSNGYIIAQYLPVVKDCFRGMSRLFDNVLFVLIRNVLW